MDQPKEKTELTLLIDRKHGTTYCINSNGRSYIKPNQIKGEKR